MTTIMLTIYVLMWPVIVSAVLGILIRAFYLEWRNARREGRDII